MLGKRGGVCGCVCVCVCVCVKNVEGVERAKSGGAGGGGGGGWGGGAGVVGGLQSRVKASATRLVGECLGSLTKHCPGF